MLKNDLLKANKCVICGNENLKRIAGYFAPFLIERMFDNEDVKSDVLFCGNCNFYFSEVRPTDEKLSKLYKDYRGEEYQKQRQKYEVEYTPEVNYALGHDEDNIQLRKYRLQDLLKNFMDFSKIKNVLDYGGDNGQCIPDCFKDANRYVYEISGVEPLEGIKSITKKDDLTKYKWDFIMCSHVLEHVSYPLDTLNHILSLVPDNGYLYLEIPYEGYIEERNNENPAHIHEHINFFRPEAFLEIFESSEYNILVNHLMKEALIGFCLVQKRAKLSKNDSLENRIKKRSIQIKQNQNSTKPINTLQQIFSVRNEGNHKVLRVLGIKMKFKRKK